MPVYELSPLESTNLCINDWTTLETVWVAGLFGGHGLEDSPAALRANTAQEAVFC